MFITRHLADGYTASCLIPRGKQSRRAHGLEISPPDADKTCHLHDPQRKRGYTLRVSFVLSHGRLYLATGPLLS